MPKIDIMPQQITPADVARMYYNDRLSKVEIARRFNTSPTWVSTMLRKRNDKLNPDEICRLRQMIAKGMTKEDIARELGVSRQTIYRYCKIYGIDVKTGELIASPVERVTSLEETEIKHHTLKHSEQNSLIHRGTVVTYFVDFQRNDVIITQGNACFTVHKDDLIDLDRELMELYKIFEARKNAAKGAESDA